MLRIGGQNPIKANRSRFQSSVGQERWLVSYSDFVTLLFAFFVVMYSVSQVSESKYRTLAETLGNAFSEQNIDPDRTEKNENTELADLEDLEALLKERLVGFPIEGEFRKSANENWVEISLNSELLFASGQAQPSEDANQLFSELADSFAEFNNQIQVIGHTDNVPIRNSSFADNWGLSAARAVSIVNILAFQGVNPERMSAVGFGEHQPLADNTTEVGRSKNRRVVIRVSAEPVVTSDDAIAEPLATEVDGQGEAELSSAQQSASPAKTDSVDTGIRTGVESIGNNDDQDNSVAQSEGRQSASLDSDIQPVTLEGGDLLFTSDPDLPRNRTVDAQ